jgi:hypothetical protein
MHGAVALWPGDKSKQETTKETEVNLSKNTAQFTNKKRTALAEGVERAERTQK